MGGGPHDFSVSVPLVLIWVLIWVDWVGVGPKESPFDKLNLKQLCVPQSDC